MPEKLIVLIFLIIFSFGVAHAQEESPFSDLSGKTTEVITKVDTFSLEDYQNALTKYDTVLSSYEKAYGREKEILGEEVIAQAKNILILKLGVFKGRLENFKEDFSSMSFSAEDGQVIADVLVDYDAFIEEVLPKVSSAENVTELRSLAKEINLEIKANISLINDYRTKYLINKSLELIGSLEQYITLLQRHISVAKEAGISFDENEDIFITAVSGLGEAGDRLASLQEQISTSSNTEDISDEVDSLADTVVNNFYDIEDIVTALQYEYGEIPWSLE